jgi:hypothetical protein
VVVIYFNIFSGGNQKKFQSGLSFLSKEDCCSYFDIFAVAVSTEEFKGLWIRLKGTVDQTDELEVVKLFFMCL